MREMIQNKQELEEIISDPNVFDNYKSQALLLDSIAFDKFQLIKTRFDMINLELSSFAEILHKYFKNYIH